MITWTPRSAHLKILPMSLYELLNNLLLVCCQP